MRRFLSGLFVLLFLFASVTVCAAEIKSLRGIAVVDVETLNVRSGPSKEYSKLGTLTRNLSVEVKGIVEPDWYLIDFEGVEGYINNEYVIFTPLEEPENKEFSIERKYIVMALAVAILILSGIIIFTVTGIWKMRDEKEGDEIIPITDHDDTNMHMGEISYDTTYRVNIDPIYFEQTGVLSQPEKVSYEESEGSWKEDLYGTPIKSTAASEEKEQETDEQQKEFTFEKDIPITDQTLEQVSERIAELQKEVDRLKKQHTDSI